MENEASSKKQPISPGLRLVGTVGPWIVVALALAFAISYARFPGDDKRVRLTEADAGKTIDLPAGSQLEIVLQGNPTTGYMWEVERVDTGILKQVGEAGFRPTSEAMGAGGTVTFLFHAVKPGTTSLEITYQRPWEADVPPINSFHIYIVVK